MAFPTCVSRWQSTRPSGRAIFLPEFLVPADQAAPRDAHLSLRVRDGVPDRASIAAVLFKVRDGCVYVAGIDHAADAGSHVEDFEHLRVAHAAVLLDQPKNRLGLDRLVDLVADRRGSAREVEQAVARDVE